MNTVLYIEDNPLNMRLVKKYLQSFGIQMIEAVDGYSGLDMALQAQPDLILVDVNLPDIDGLEVTRRLRNNDETAEMPIVALTANAMHGDRERCLNSGCDGYLAKPVSRVELVNMLRSYLPESFAAGV
jgi:two-component system, cell cycle response regulator DivK